MRVDQIAGQRAADTPASVVLLHGIGGSARIWTPQLESLATANLRLAAIDLLGHGARPPVDKMDFNELAADLEAAILRLELERPVLVGHSMGGMIAQTAVRRRPSGYRALVLCSTSPAFGDPNGEFQKRFVADRLRPLDAGYTMREIASLSVDAAMGPHSDSSGRSLAIDIMASTPASTFRAAVHCLTGFDERANLSNIKVPVLCLVGQQDASAPAEMMRRMAAKIPTARYVCLPGVGHFPNLEAPQAFNAAVLDFLHAALASTGAESAHNE